MSKRESVTVVLNIYKRPYLKEQLAAILSQTVSPADIWLIQLGNYLNPQPLLRKFPEVKYIHSTVDIKFFGRFSLARFAATKYCFIIDDDIIPSATWIERCIYNCEKYDAIVCSNGRRIPVNDFTPEVPKSENHFAQYFIGDALASQFNYCNEVSLVDYPSSSYFIKTKWLEYFWGINPYTLQNGDDIHLGASCMVLGQIPVIVPAQKVIEDSGNIKPKYSLDQYATFKKHGFISTRKKVFQYLIRKHKWTPLLWARV